MLKDNRNKKDCSYLSRRVNFTPQEISDRLFVINRLFKYAECCVVFMFISLDLAAIIDE